MTATRRRRLLKGIALTAPFAWSKPVIDTVILPVHAQTSPEEAGGGNGSEGCDPVTIPGITLTPESCPGEFIDIETCWRPFVNDSGCPDFEIVPCETAQDCDFQMQVAIFGATTGNLVSNLGFRDGGDFTITQASASACGEGDTTSQTLMISCNGFTVSAPVELDAGNNPTPNISLSIGPATMTFDG